MTINRLFTRSITLAMTISLLISTIALPEDAYARRVRGHTRVNINRNINRNTNVNINRNVNVRRGYYGGRHHRYHDHNNGIGVGAAIAIGVAGLAVGSIITAASMPPSCNMVNVNGLTYQRCGNTWYQPQYAGSQVNYVVVNPPR
jgi:hypothetical protein